MNIGEAAAKSGLSRKMIRYYENYGLLPQAQRSNNGYRHYQASDLRRLRFIHRARELGFSLEEVSRLLALWDDQARASAEVKQLAKAHIIELEQRIAELQQLKASLEQLTHCCHGDERPECPILDALAGHDSAAENSLNR